MALSILQSPAPARGRRPVVKSSQISRLTIPAQVRLAFRRDARIAAVSGCILGGFVPVASWQLVHYEVHGNPWLWALVAGGLLYSSLSVYRWAVKAFHAARLTMVKAAGFVVIVEGVATFSGTQWLSISALSLLVVINAISAAVAIQAID